MRHPVTYTFLGFYFNSLIDAGEILDIRKTHEQMRSKSLFPWLKEKFGTAIDISLFSEQEMEDIESYFQSMSERHMSEERGGGGSSGGPGGSGHHIGDYLPDNEMKKFMAKVIKTPLTNCCYYVVCDDCVTVY